MSPSKLLPFTQVDAFTDTPFGGNPAAVVVLDQSLSDAAMQTIAAEMNLSETAFTGTKRNGERWLRWFTPLVEVPLCGHATLATAHALIEAGHAGPLRFTTSSGEVEVHADGDRLRLDFPADPPALETPPAELLSSLGCGSECPTLRARNLWVVRVGSTSVLRNLKPDFSSLGRVDLGPGGLGVSVTAAGTGGLDFESRFFCPWVGIDEDPVTGIAHTALTPYWAAELGRETMTCRQVSRRGGELTVSLVGERTHLTGSAITVARGEILNPDA